MHSAESAKLMEHNHNNILNKVVYNSQSTCLQGVTFTVRNLSEVIAAFDLL